MKNTLLALLVLLFFLAVTGCASSTAAAAGAPSEKGASRNYVVSDFESKDVLKTFQKNPGGDTLQVALDGTYKGDGNSALMLTYDFTNGSSYAGGHFDVPDLNWKGAKGIEFYLKPNGKDHQITILIREKSGEFWAADYVMKQSQPKTVRLPFSAFHIPSWYSGGDGIQDLTDVQSVTILLRPISNDYSNSIIWIDGLKAYSE
jgi:hypothetical protein